MKKVFFFTSFLYCVTSAAQVQEVHLKKVLPVENTIDLYQMFGATKAKKLTPLAQLKEQEIHLKWNECAQGAASVFTKHKELRGWIGQTWLRCLEQIQKKKSNPASLEKPLLTLWAHKELFLAGPWSSELRQKWVRLRLIQLEAMPTKQGRKIEEGLENLLTSTFDLSKEQKAKVYQLLGDGALAQVDYKRAQFFYEEAQDQKDSKYLQEKLDFLMKALGDTSATKTVTESGVEPSGEEIKLEERVRQSLKQNEAIHAIKDAVVILNQFPGSRAAKRLKDKPLEIYNSLSEDSVKMQALNEMSEVDSARLVDWAQALHKRGDYKGALALSQKAAVKNFSSPQSTTALWIAGRSAHFLGEYDRALEFFSTLTTAHQGSEEAAEALFRSSLIQYRKKNYSNASALLERLLQQGRDRYDLVARYWLVRSFQETNPERARQTADELIAKYPLTYYGLRLLAEKQNGKLTWPEVKEAPPALKEEIYLVGDQKKSWQRFVELSQAGWVNEARLELTEMPFIKSPTLKVQWAQKLAEQHQYSTAIRLINEAMEKDARLRREQFVKISYPEVFNSLYQNEAQRYGMSAVLLRSLTRQESAFNLQAVSTSNAMGLMQMIPPTAQEIAKKLSMKVELPEDMFRPEVNIPMGSFYVSQMLDQFQGNVPFALAAYNAGPYRLRTWLEGREELQGLLSQASSAPRDEVWFDELPWSETSFYVKAILRNILLYRLVAEGSFELKPVLWQDLLNKKSK